MNNELYIELQALRMNMGSCRVHTRNILEDMDKYLCRFRINNGHGYHKCKAAATCFFFSLREVGAAYMLCEKHASQVRKHIDYLKLRERSIQEYIVSEVMNF